MCNNYINSKRYVVGCNSRYDSRTLYLVDRTKTREKWWSNFTSDALIFRNKKDAEKVAKQYKYNNVRVIEL